MIKALSFDLDDTLWECAPAMKKAETAFLEYLKQHYPKQMQCYTFEQYTQEKIAFMRANTPLKGDVTRMRIAFVKDLLQGVDDLEHQALECFKFFYQKRSEVILYPDTLKTLETLTELYPLAALTNGNADLKQIGIAHLFKKVICASLEKPAKPDPYMFDQTCAAFNIQSHELLHIGDNPETDIQGAKLAGVKTLWINRHAMTWPEELQRADYEMTELANLAEWLSNL